MHIISILFYVLFSVKSSSTVSPSRSYINCDKCKIEIPRHEYRYHKRTNIHKSNCLIKSEFEHIDIIATAFKNRIMTYRLNPSIEDEYLLPEAFLDGKRDDVFKLVELSLIKNTCIKVNFELFAYFILPKSGEQQLKSFNTKYEVIYKSTDFDEIYLNVRETFKMKLTEFEHCESGWSLTSLSHLEININKYSPMRGGSYIELPEVIKKTKSCINIQNNDEYCFLWSILAALFPVKNNVCRTSSYPHFSTIFNITGMSFPLSPKDIRLFENNNSDLSINIYGLDKHFNVTGPLYTTNFRRDKHINLLYYEKENRAHYCLIKNLLRLVRRQVSKHKGRMYLCETCLQFFTSETKFHSHACSKIITLLPDKNSMLQFKHFERQQKINFVIYADFESLLCNFNEVNTEKNKNTIKNKLHQPSCFAYYVCCSHDCNLNKFVSYRGPDCVQVFVKKIIEETKSIHEILTTKKTMKPMTPEQIDNYRSASTCHICKKILFDDKVRDHDHITSEYRGAAHSHCNLIYRVCPFIPVVFHNLSGYDSHLFIRELAKYDGEIKIIPKTKEKYLSITKNIETSKYNKPLQIKFIDSFQFLNTSLDNLSKSLESSDFLNLRSVFPDDEKFCLIRRKGVYPYEYIDSWQKYNETQLPPKHCFYNSIQKEHITDSEYEHAQTIWSCFNINSLGDYTDLYLKCDVLLLCDIFENFRNICLQHYNLDPAYYISSPGLSWDAMLLYTGIQLELIHDLEMYNMIEKGIRGGLAQCSHRYAKANNIYLPHFDDSKPSTYLVYLDCNNLYGHAMTRKLPISDFKFMTSQEIVSFRLFDIPDDAEYGYILEVDLMYPEYLHNLHSDLPFAPEKFIPIGGKTEKLIANLYDKYNYVIHYIHLKECIKNGLVMKKIHRILQFKQENFLKKYIDLNTQLRQSAKTSFEKDFFKLLNNSVFGKTIENKRKQIHVRLVTKWNDNKNRTNKTIGAEKLIAKPNLKSICIFSEDFIAIQLTPDKLVLDRPIYVGLSVLEYAKQHMYNFHYDFIKNKYGDNVKLCYTDTDSLLYLIHTQNFYKDLNENIIKFDTSNFDFNNPYSIPKINNKIPGLFKDELGGDVISEFTGLRAKLYCIKSIKTQINKAKGVSRPITKKLKISNYKRVLFKNITLQCKMNMIKSSKHVLYSQEVNKVILNRVDDKRIVQTNQIDTLPWGHCDHIC
ncbi:unnamed protein product [Spodoptera littoralis]|uniref:DNA-directed DNA polymerase n=2 Tax=Spodoptera TaxID=7106 RepID=A0A9P0IDE5_SPOLI|nr:unnamed protein product [Spodoptera littoralis]